MFGIGKLALVLAPRLRRVVSSTSLLVSSSAAIVVTRDRRMNLVVSSFEVTTDLVNHHFFIGLFGLRVVPMPSQLICLEGAGLGPLDLNVDSDGFADFGRAYFPGTVMTVTAPKMS